jgi:hypothetical protein
LDKRSIDSPELRANMPLFEIWVNNAKISDRKSYTPTAWDTDMQESSRIQAVCTKVNLHEQASDFAYWQSQSYEARVTALEQIRQDYHRWKYGAEPRFQRVCTVTQR